MEVAGFRFDLGTILGREPNGFDQRSGFFDAIGQDPVLCRLKMIGEPWDIGPGGYQVGALPRRGSPAPETSTICAAAVPGPASTSSRRMTASRSTISSPTTSVTTR